VFSFVIELAPSGRKNYFNGYIVAVKQDMIILLDSKLQKEIPILLDYIEVIEPSRKEDENDRKRDG
jgi:hypothetical protein